MSVWLRQGTSVEQKTVLACLEGWSLDALDEQMSSLVAPRRLFRFGVAAGGQQQTTKKMAHPSGERDA